MSFVLFVNHDEFLGVSSDEIKPLGGIYRHPKVILFLNRELYIRLEKKKPPPDSYVKDCLDKIRCWWCCIFIEKKCIGIPCRYGKKGIEYEGYFCNWPCMFAFLVEERNKVPEYRVQKWVDAIGRVKFDYFEATGEEIRAALHWRSLRCFGGEYKSIMEDED